MTSGYTSFDALNDEKTIDSAAELDKIMEPTDSQRGTMKALIFSRYGKPTDLNVLQEIQMPIPTITKDDQVLVKVLFASSNSVDLKIISGMFGFVSPKKPNHVTGSFHSLNQSQWDQMYALSARTQHTQSVFPIHYIHNLRMRFLRQSRRQR